MVRPSPHPGQVQARKNTADAHKLEAVRRLVEQWEDTPDYTPSDYDQGRVDQRHDMVGQLREVLDD